MYATCFASNCVAAGCCMLNRHARLPPREALSVHTPSRVTYERGAPLTE